MQTERHSRFQAIRDFATRNKVLLIECGVCFLLVWLHALQAGHYVDFFPINGTFQNFNPVRRLLDGQMPYRDFQDYLGMGHLYLGTAATVLFGGDFQGSLMAFSFLTLAGFAGISYVVGKAVFGKGERAMLATDILLVTMLVWPLFLSNALAGMEEIRKSLEYALGTGNSARFIRGMILPMSCGIVWVGKGIIDQRSNPDSAWWKHALLVGATAGFSFAWSNDYGISCWLCLLLMSFWHSLSMDRGVVKSLLSLAMSVVASVAMLFVTVEVATVGHFGDWAAATFGTGGYQSWYYNSSFKSYYLWDVDMSFVVLTQVVLCLHYLWRMWRDGHKGDLRAKEVILGYVNMTSICAVEEYRLLSGGGSREVALAVLFLCIIYEFAQYVLQGEGSGVQKARRIIGVAAAISCVAWSVSVMRDEFVIRAMDIRDGTYFEELGGTMRDLGEDIEATDKWLDGEKAFSTYASAQEVVSGYQQPSGVDYIIHVLGDEAREKYLNSFHTADFRYVATMQESFTHWEYWVQRANWFFYRELYRNWHPVFANQYEKYWERNDETDNYTVHDGIKVTTEEVTDAVTKISVECDESVNGIADVYINYNVVKRGGKVATVNFRRALQVVNTGHVHVRDGYFESNFLRDESAEYIPVPVADGKGEVTLTACPSKSAYLVLNDVSCDMIYTVSSQYVEIGDITEKGGTSTLHVPLLGSKDRGMFDSVSAIEYGGERHPIAKITYDDTTAYIEIDGHVEEAEENFAQLIRDAGEPPAEVEPVDGEDAPPASMGQPQESLGRDELISRDSPWL